jgi:acetyl esterase/lipase
VTTWTTEALADRFPVLASVDIQPASVAGPHGSVPVRLYRGREVVAALVWLHGAFAFGDLDMPEAHWVSMSLAASGVAVCSVDYRLAVNGVHYPAPVDDALAAWQWAVENAPFGAVPLHLGGASSGGCIVASAAKRIRDTRATPPASLVLVYPLVHSELPEPTDELRQAIAGAPADALIFDADLTRDITRNYVGDDRLFADPYAFAANGDLRGLPPTYIVNEHDTLRASSEPFAAALAAADVAVVMETEPGALHGHINEPSLDAAHRTVERLVSWLRSR